MRNTDKDRTLAAALTFLVALAILLFLFFGGISWDPRDIAEASTPELMPEEELFIEPELVELGEEVAVTKDKPAPTLKGEPEPAPEDRVEIVEPGPKSKPNPKPVEKVVTSKRRAR